MSKEKIDLLPNRQNVNKHNNLSRDFIYVLCKSGKTWKTYEHGFTCVTVYATKQIAPCSNWCELDDWIQNFTTQVIKFNCLIWVSRQAFPRKICQKVRRVSETHGYALQYYYPWLWPVSQHISQLPREHTMHAAIIGIKRYPHSHSILLGTQFYGREKQSPHDNSAAHRASNLWPFGYESYALTNCAIMAQHIGWLNPEFYDPDRVSQEKVQKSGCQKRHGYCNVACAYTAYMESM